MEDGSRKKVISINVGGRNVPSPTIEIHRSAEGGFEVREVQAKPPKVDLPRRPDPRYAFGTHRLEPASLSYMSPWQQFLLPHRPVPMPVQRTIEPQRSVDPQTIEIQKPVSRTIQIQRIDSSASPQLTPHPDVSGISFGGGQPQLARPPDMEVHTAGPRRIEIQRSDSLGTGSPMNSPDVRANVQSPLFSPSGFTGGTRSIHIQRGGIERTDSPTQRVSSPSLPGTGGVRRIEIQRVNSPVVRSDSSPQSPISPGGATRNADGILQFPRRIEIQRTDSPLARSDSPPQRSSSSSPTVEVYKFGPHTLEIKRGGVPVGGNRMLEIQQENSSGSSSGNSSPTHASSRVIEIQRSDSPSSASPPGSPRVSSPNIISGGARMIPIQRLDQNAPRPTPQGAEMTSTAMRPPEIGGMRSGVGGPRILQIHHSDQPHQMQVHPIQPPHLEIQPSEPTSPNIRQGPMNIRWPSSRRVEIRGILGRGLQRNRTLSFTIRGGKIEMGGLEGGKIFSLRAPKEDVAIIEREVKPAIHRGEPDGEANSFLKQKEAQLREKREREREAEREKEREQEREKERKLQREKEQDLRDKELLQQQEQQEQRQQEQQQLLLEKEEREAEREALRVKTIELNKSVITKEIKPVPEPIKVTEPEMLTVTPAVITPVEIQQPKQKETVPVVVQPAPLKPEPIAQKPQLKKTVVSPPVRDISAKIPQFYFPLGKPIVKADGESQIQKVKDVFAKLDSGKAVRGNFSAISKALALPVCWKSGLYLHAGGEKSGHVTLQSFLAMWRKLCSTCYDDAARFVRLYGKQGCNYMVAEDFVPLVQDIVDSHPGLTFLQDAPEFHSRYIHTVISRIFYCVNRSWSGRITVTELRRSNFLQTLMLLEEEDDINQIADFFSYEHFYVIYCKFWELDKDHDLFISKDDLAKHNDHAISSRMIDRIFSGAVTRGRAQKEGKMSYTEFVWFLISEEDKRHPTSIEYWFRCMDLDGDGVISMYEMEYFYEEQVQRMEALGIETLPYEDCLCQMLDMVKPKDEGRVSLTDLKACKMTPIFFDTFFNLEKYLEHEQKDPFANVRDGDEPELSDWERYAAEEYEILVAEEGAGEGHQEEVMYEDDFEPDDDEPLSGRQDTTLNDKGSKARGSGRAGSPEDDIYDFSKKDLGY